jgi:glycosyltransferase involved in cell wall biosynthesis
MFFSIIVPTYNRERFIKRCLMSVLAQDFKDFEIIVVDDGSTDGTAASVRAFTDSRLRLIVQEKNRGKGPACNTGNAAARGDWIVSLDSDDELLPGALTCMYKHAIAGSEAIDAHWFRCRMDDGRICPDPLPSRLEWDYDGFLAFREETRGRWPDMVRCVRRKCFDRIHYASNRMGVDKFHFDFARLFRSLAHDEVLRLYHQDAGDRLVEKNQSYDLGRDREYIEDLADGFSDLMRAHGPDMRCKAPGLYGDYLRRAAANAILANRRFAGLAYAATLAWRLPTSARSWMFMAASIIGPGPTIWLSRRVPATWSRDILR